MNLSENCAICRMSMLRKQVIKLQPCHHLFHSNCFEPLTNDPHAVCPICREETHGSEKMKKVQKKNQSQDRQRIVACSNKGEDWISLASTLGIKYKTAFHWVRSGRDVMLKKGGGKPKVLSEQQMDIIITWIEEDSGYTLKQLKEKVLRDFRKSVCVSTLGNYSEGRIFTLKQVHVEPTQMNSNENKRKRAENVPKLNQFIQQGRQIVWMDETNFNLFCRRSRGRARKGVRAVQYLPAARGPSVHLIGAISAAGVVTMERQRGSFTSDLTNRWVTSLLQQWENLGKQIDDLVIVCDNAPCHSCLEMAINGTGATLLRLTPYSPMLNPIEAIFSVNDPGIVNQRLVYLEGVIDEAKEAIVRGDCARAAQHTTTHHAGVLEMADMPVGH